MFDSILNQIFIQEDCLFANSFNRAVLYTRGSALAEKLHDDIQKLHTADDILFPTLGAAGLPETFGQKISKTLSDWRHNPPSIPALICIAAEHFGIPAESEALQAALMAGIAAEMPHPNAYHNTDHFREVTAAVIRLCHAHNQLAAAPLSAEDIAKMLLAAAGHDLLHDGKDNMLNGVHTQYRLENKAIGALEPFMSISGMAEMNREDIRALIRITDISAPAGKSSPRQTLKNLIESQASAIPAELAPLAQNKKLVAMAAMMSDADLSASTAGDISFTRMINALLSRENPKISPTDESFVGFVSDVVGGRFLSPAGRALSQTSLEAILSAARSSKTRAAKGPNP